jgi:hypothetical protein
VATRESATDRLEPGSFVATETGVYRETPQGLERWTRAATIEDLTELLDQAGRAYVLEEEADGRIWVYCQ